MILFRYWIVGNMYAFMKYFIGSGGVVGLPQFQWCDPEEYG